MATKPSQRPEPKTRTLAVETTWRPGQRTQAWERLWARVLADVFPDLTDTVRVDRRSAGVDASEPAARSGSMGGSKEQGAAGGEAAADGEKRRGGD